MKLCAIGYQTDNQWNEYDSGHYSIGAKYNKTLYKLYKLLLDVIL